MGYIRLGCLNKGKQRNTLIMSLARATVSGTIVTDIEKRYTPNNTPVSNFTIIVNPTASSTNSNRMDQPSPVRITCWRGLAEQSATQLRRGDSVVVEGRLQIAQLDNQTVGGYAKKQYEVDASAIFRGRVDALSGPANVNLSAGGGYAAAPANPYGSAPAPVSGLSNSIDTTQQQTSSQPIQAAPTAAAMGTVTFDDDITEDDIPF